MAGPASRQPPRRGGPAGTRPPVSRAWAPFTRALADVLAVLGDDQFLILSGKSRNVFVQFACQGPQGLRAEAVSNAYLEPEEALDRAALARLRTLGWRQPSGPAEWTDTPEKCPDGSPNFFREWPVPVPVADAAALAVTTLREIYGIPHPSFLVYTAFERGGRALLLPTLRVGRAPEPERPGEDAEATRLTASGGEGLKAAVLAVLRSFTRIEDLAPDSDGDIPLRHGSAMIFVRVLGDSPVVELFSPLLSDVELSTQLLEALNGLNVEYRFVRFFHTVETVFAAVHLRADPFVPSQLTDSLAALAQICDAVDTDLQARFGGETFFKDDDRQKPRRGPTLYN